MKRFQLPEGIFRIIRRGEGAGQNADAAGVAQVVPVKDDGGAVQALEALLRLKGAAQDVAVQLGKRFTGEMVGMYALGENYAAFDQISY